MQELEKALQLTMGQQFQLRLFADQIETMTVEDLKAALLETSRQLMIKNNVLITLMKH
jgi:hypothetical protein